MLCNPFESVFHSSDALSKAHFKAHCKAMCPLLLKSEVKLPWCLDSHCFCGLNVPEEISKQHSVKQWSTLHNCCTLWRRNMATLHRPIISSLILRLLQKFNWPHVGTTSQPVNQIKSARSICMQASWVGRGKITWLLLNELLLLRIPVWGYL